MVFTIKFSALDPKTEQTRKLETKKFNGMWEGGLAGRVAAYASKLKKSIEEDETIVTHVMDIQLDTEEIGEFDDQIQAFVDERANGVKNATSDLFPTVKDKPAPKEMDEEIEFADESEDSEEPVVEAKKEKFDWRKFAKKKDDEEPLEEAKMTKKQEAEHWDKTDWKKIPHEELKKIGYELFKHADGEWRVNVIGGKDTTAYYSDDKADAVNTAKSEAARASKKNIKEETCKYQVLVGNIGITYDGDSKKEAMKIYDEYVKQSKTNKGRAGGEDVIVMCDDEPIKEYIPLDKN